MFPFHFKAILLILSCIYASSEASNKKHIYSDVLPSTCSAQRSGWIGPWIIADHFDNRWANINDQSTVLKLRAGDGLLPAGWNPFGYQITTLGQEFLKYEGSLDSDVGRFLASMKASRKTKAAIKSNWLEIVRVSKTGQAMRIYRQLDDLLQFCLKAGLID